MQFYAQLGLTNNVSHRLKFRNKDLSLKSEVVFFFVLFCRNCHFVAYAIMSLKQFICFSFFQHSAWLYKVCVHDQSLLEMPMVYFCGKTRKANVTNSNFQFCQDRKNKIFLLRFGPVPTLHFGQSKGTSLEQVPPRNYLGFSFLAPQSQCTILTFNDIIFLVKCYSGIQQKFNVPK